MSMDPAVVASKQFTVLVDNERVRLLKISVGPHEKVAMHAHPDSVLVCLTEMNMAVTYPDGRSEDVRVGAGEVRLMPAITHQQVNKTANRFEGYLTELKG